MDGPLMVAEMVPAEDALMRAVGEAVEAAGDHTDLYGMPGVVAGEVTLVWPVVLVRERKVA